MLLAGGFTTTQLTENARSQPSATASLRRLPRFSSIQAASANQFAIFFAMAGAARSPSCKRNFKKTCGRDAGSCCWLAAADWGMSGVRAKRNLQGQNKSWACEDPGLIGLKAVCSVCVEREKQRATGRQKALLAQTAGLVFCDKNSFAPRTRIGAPLDFHGEAHVCFRRAYHQAR